MSFSLTLVVSKVFKCASMLLKIPSMRASNNLCCRGLEDGCVLQSHYASIMHKISMTALFMPQVLALLACFGNIFFALSCTGENNGMRIMIMPVKERNITCL